MNSKLTALDFFCGGGGFSEGLIQAGIHVERAYDHWQPAVKTHQMNHPDTEVMYKDILEIAYLPNDEFEELVPDTDIIVGSPPCVAFSNSNNSGNADKTLGIKLLEAYLTIISRKKFKPNSQLKFWVLENVPNVQKYLNEMIPFKQDFVEGVLEINNESSKVYKMDEYGIPSTRRRYFCGDFPPPKNLNKPALTIGEVKNILSKDVVYDIFTETILDSENVTDHNYQYLLADFEWQKAERQKLDKGYMGKMAFPENEDKPSRTVMATLSKTSRESIIYKTKDGQYRLPTVRELATFMSFPIDYRFYGNTITVKHKLVGNAVPPHFSFLLGCSMLEHMNLKVEKVNIKRYWEEFNDHDFINLNGTFFPLNVEKQKRFGTKYKYHIPYMILNTFRVELTAVVYNNKPKWEVVIHKGQGSRKQEIRHIPDIEKYIIRYANKTLIQKFISSMKDKIINNDELYSQYLTPQKKRQFGPDELLEQVANFIQSNSFEYLSYEYGEISIPSKIIVGYYILTKIIDVEVS